MKNSDPSFFRFAGCVASCVVGLLFVTNVSAQGGWIDCSAEGQTCNVRGPSTVRYGNDAEYAYRNVNGPVPCTNEVFGDPIRGETKRCSYRYGHNQSPQDRHPGDWNGSGWSGNNAGNERGWEFCAQEDRFCNFRGTREVRFGAAGRYAVRTVTGGTDCNVRVFGDPNPKVKKTCEIHAGSNWGGGYNRPSIATDRGNWRFCAEEDGYCRAPRGVTVRFGADGRYAYMNRVSGEVSCSVNTFGDPYQGERKRCEFEVR